MLEERLTLIRSTPRWQTAVKATADKMNKCTVTEFNELIDHCIENGADTELAIVLEVCALNKICIKPELLAESLKVVEPCIDFAPPYRWQTADTIEPLLAVAQSEELSWERKAYALLVAAELTQVHGVENTVELQNLLSVMQCQTIGDGTMHLLTLAQVVLENGPQEGNEEYRQYISQSDPLKWLPVEKPPVRIGDGGTIRRAVPKLGRNAPCHCGSGKKYKKCCYEADQQKLRESTSHEGLTRQELMTQARTIEDHLFIHRMRAYEIKQLKADNLNEPQLIAAYQHAALFGLMDVAMRFLLELAERPEQKQTAYEHMEDLLYHALDAGELGTADHILTLLDRDALHDWQTVDLHLSILKQQNIMKKLEAALASSIFEENAEHNQFDDAILHLCHGLEKPLPALSIALARARLVGNPPPTWEAELIMEIVRTARGRLGLDPWEDPLEDVYDDFMQKEQQLADNARQSEELSALKIEARAAERKAREFETQLRRAEAELSHAHDQQTIPTAPDPAISHPPKKQMNPPETQATLERLRMKVTNLKAEISEQQVKKRQLRDELRSLYSKSSNNQHTLSSSAKEERLSAHFPKPQVLNKVIIPNYTPAFRQDCETLQAGIVSKALKSIALFASNDENIWRQTRSIQSMKGYYRIKIGRNYRLMLYWEPDTKLDILELITREQMDGWIKNHR